MYWNRLPRQGLEWIFSFLEQRFRLDDFAKSLQHIILFLGSFSEHEREAWDHLGR